MLFATWKGTTLDMCEIKEDLKRSDCQVAWYWHTFKTLGRRVTHATRADTKAFFDHFAQQAGDLDDGRFSQDFWKAIRRYFPAMKKRKIGYAPLQIAELEEQWVPHFANLESGSVVAPQQLLNDCWTRQQENAAEVVTLKKPSELPSILEVERALRNTRPHRAAGPEGIDPDVIFVSSGFIFMTVSFEISFILFYFIHFYTHISHQAHTQTQSQKPKVTESNTHTQSHNQIQ